MSKRLGNFKISAEFINIAPEWALIILSTVIVVRAELHYLDNNIWYTGISEHFRIINSGGITPEYTAELDYNNGEVIWIEVK